jgi:hypothetical protein
MSLSYAAFLGARCVAMRVAFLSIVVDAVEGTQLLSYCHGSGRITECGGFECRRVT